MQRQSKRTKGSRGVRLVRVSLLLVGCQYTLPTRPKATLDPLPRAAVTSTATSRPQALPGTTETPTQSAAETVPPPHQPPVGVWSELTLDEFEPALLWYKNSAPVFVITHGAGGHAAWHCQHYHRLLDGRATLICPQGKLRHAKEPALGYYYPDHLALRREVLSAVERFEALAPQTLARRPYVYAGYSQGATMGALAFAEHGELFSQLVLVEGGFADWSDALISRFRATGGGGVLFICGTKQCATQATSAAGRFVAHGLKSSAFWAKGAGHIPDGAVGQTLSEHLGFLLDLDPRWQGFTPNREDYSAPRSE